MSFIAVGLRLVPWIATLLLSVNCAVLNKRCGLPLRNSSMVTANPAPPSTPFTPLPVQASGLPLLGAFVPPPSPAHITPAVISPTQTSQPPMNSPTTIPTSTNEPPKWRVAAVGGAATSRLDVSPSPLITPAPNSASLTTHDSSIHSGCTPYAPCNIFFQSVGVHYWPQPGHNTLCLDNSQVAQPAQSQNKAVREPAHGSGYAVFTSIRASDGCRQIGTTFVDYTATFGPGDLSSVRDHSTYSFNFADLPCPPESVHWTESKPYTPTIAFPHWLTGLDPAWSTCIAGSAQGIDPFTAFPSAMGDSGFNAGPARKRHRRTVHGRRVPMAALAITTAATS